MEGERREKWNARDGKSDVERRERWRERGRGDRWNERERERESARESDRYGKRTMVR